MSIKNLSHFELLTNLARLSKTSRLHDNIFPITYISDFFCKSTTTGVVEIEMVPIYHTSVHTLRHVYFYIIADYLSVVNILHGITGSLIQNVCTAFVFYISQLLLLFSL